MRLQSLAELLRQGDDCPWLARYAEFRDRSFVALNTAFMEDGAVMLVPAGCRLAEPIHIVFIATGRAQPRVSTRAILLFAAKEARSRSWRVMSASARASTLPLR